MQNSLRQALQAQVTFEITGDSTNTKKLAFLPGIYDAMKQVTVGEGKETHTAFIDPTDLQNAGYFADQVADDYNSSLNASNGQYVRIQGVGRIRYRDFLNTVQRVGATVNKIIIQNKVASQDIAADRLRPQQDHHRPERHRRGRHLPFARPHA